VDELFGVPSLEVLLATATASQSLFWWMSCSGIAVQVRFDPAVNVEGSQSLFWWMSCSGGGGP